MLAIAPDTDEMDSELEMIDRLLAERSLKEFILQAWHVVEPATPFMDGPHIDAIVEHLEAVTRREIRQLLINIPPRCMKSLIVSVFWPAWVWTTQPHIRWMYASYAQKLSDRDSMKCRRIIESQWYQRNWGRRFKLRDDQNAKARFDNTRSGFRLATSTGGAATGEGGDFTVVDDPHSALDGLSDTLMSEAQIWFDEVWSSRLNDQRTGCRVVIMQRISEKDISGHILKKADWDHLMLPMEFEADRRCKTSIGFTDWRKKDGELLWPDRIGQPEVQSLKKALGRYGVAGQLQQSPTPRGGGMFERHWFEVVPAAPAGGQIVRYWDRAATQDDGDWSSGLKMTRDEKGVYYIMDVVRLQGTPLKVEQAILNTAAQDGTGVHIVLEQDPGQAGIADVGYLIRQLAGYAVSAKPVTKDKETRAMPTAAQAEAGNIKVVKGGWNERFLDEVSLFPRGDNDDQVDTMSGAFNHLTVGRKILVA